MPPIGTTRGNAGKSTKRAKRIARRAAPKPAPPSRSDAAQRPGARTPKPRPAPKPPAPVQRGHASEGGKTIRPKTVRKIRRSQERRARGKSDAAQGNSTREADAFKRTDEFKDTQKAAKKARLYRALRNAPEKNASPGSSAVLDVLEQTTRPVHAVAGTTNELLKGNRVDRAVGEGAKAFYTEKQKTLFSDVLKTAGAPKIVQSVGGFALDVAADPTTYATFGAGTLAKQAAVKAGRDAAKKATAKGLSAEQAKRFGERAAKQAAKAAPAGKGITVKLAGKEAPGVRKATAKAGKVTGKVVRKATPEKARAGGRRVVAEVRPTVRPDKAVPKAERDEIRRAARTARYSTSREIEKTKLKARAIKRELKGRDQEVLDAIEVGTIRKLPADLRGTAKRLQDEFKYARRLERRAGVNVAKRKRYVPHALREELDKGEGIVSSGVRDPKGSFQKGRKEKRTLKEIRKTDPGKYSEDAPLLYANRLAEGVRTVKKADLNRRLMDMGRTLKRGSDAAPKKGERIYHVKGARIREPDAHEIDRFLEKGDTGRGGRYVILNESTANEALKVGRAPERSQIGTNFDYAQGKWKFLATQPNPGFHVRNFIGDTMNAYKVEPGHKLVVNLRESKRALKRLNRQEKALLLGKQLDPDSKGLKIDGKRVAYHDLIREAEGVGAIRAGFTGRELADLATTTEGVKKVRGKFKGTKTQRTSQFFKNREDLPRLATYIGGRKRGLSPEKAAEHASRPHFDYADLTDFERRVMRRLMPFYTFSARNIPFQFQTLFAKPGKYANYQKLREEVAKAFGVDLDKTENDLAPQEKRSAPLVVKWKGKQFTLSLGPSGLPLTDLNEFPTTTNPAKVADEWMTRAASLLSPAAKTPIELYTNISFFFRDQIERETGPLVPAPAVVATLPKRLRDELGIVPDYVDARSGKKQWGWPAKTDYVASVLTPGPLGFTKRILTPSERKNQSGLSKTVGYVGLRSVPVDAESQRIQEAYEKRAELGKKLATLRQRKNPRNDLPIRADNATSEYSKLLNEYSKLDKALAAKRTARGDENVPQRGRPKTVRRSATSGSGSSSSSSSGFQLGDYGSGSGSSGSAGSSGGFQISEY